MIDLKSGFDAISLHDTLFIQNERKYAKILNVKPVKLQLEFTNNRKLFLTRTDE